MVERFIIGRFHHTNAAFTPLELSNKIEATQTKGKKISSTAYSP